MNRGEGARPRPRGRAAIAPQRADEPSLHLHWQVKIAVYWMRKREIHTRSGRVGAYLVKGIRRRPYLVSREAYLVWDRELTADGLGTNDASQGVDVYSFFIFPDGQTLKAKLS